MAALPALHAIAAAPVLHAVVQAAPGAGGAVAVPAPARPVTLAEELRGSGLRMTVAFGSLAAGQVILGEQDASRILRRASVGAVAAEVGGFFVRWVQRSARLDAPLDATLLASYGERELALIADTVDLALLRNRIGR